MNELLDKVVKDELSAGEQVLWSATPDVDSIRSSLLFFAILWLSGLFLISVGLLRDSSDEAVLPGLIILLVIIGGILIFELVLVPRRASRTVYVVTNQRIMSLCATKRFVPNISDRDDEKVMLRRSHNSVPFFFMMNIPAQLLYLVLAYDVFTTFITKQDLFVGLGFVIATLAWLQPTVMEMRLPFPRFRDAPRCLYATGDIFVLLEVLELADYAAFMKRKIGRGMTNLFLLGRRSGCVRFRAVADYEKLESVLHEISRS